MPTQKDVASVAGVDQSTVSLALRGDPRISPETRRRVLEAAKKLGYKPFLNADAKRMIARRHGRPVRTNIIAFVRSSRKALLEDAWGWHLLFLAGIESEAYRSDMQLLLVSAEGKVLPPNLRRGEIDGVIFYEEATGRKLAGLDLPKVGIVNPLSPWCVKADDFKAGYSAAEHLIGLGHERIAYVSPKVADRNCLAYIRMEGFRAALSEAGLLREELIVLEGSSTDPSAGEEAYYLLKARGELPTAVVAYNDTMAIGVLWAAVKDGLEVPGDLSIVGMDDLKVASSISPSLTTVRMPLEEIGREAVGMILAQWEDPLREPECRILPVRLVVRESTGPPKGARR